MRHYPDTPLSLWEEIVRDGPIARGEHPGGPNKPRQVHQRRRGKTPHKLLLEACVQALRLTWGQAHVEVRNVALTRFKDRQGNERKARFGQKGEADIRFTLFPIAVALECKARETGDTQRYSQERWQERWERAGGYYAVVHDAEAAVAAVKDAFAKALERVRKGDLLAGAPESR